MKRIFGCFGVYKQFIKDSRQCTATADCSAAEAADGSASPGAAGLLWPVAVCGEVGLRDWGEFARKAGMCAGSPGKPGTEAGEGLIGTGMAGRVCPP